MQPAQWVVQFNGCYTNGLILLPIDNIHLNLGTCRWIGIQNEKQQASRSGNKGNARKKTVLCLLVNNKSAAAETNDKDQGKRVVLQTSHRYWGYDTTANTFKFKLKGVSSTYINYLHICITTSFLVSSNILLSYFLLYHAVILIKLNVD